MNGDPVGLLLPAAARRAAVTLALIIAASGAAFAQTPAPAAAAPCGRCSNGLPVHAPRRSVRAVAHLMLRTT